MSARALALVAGPSLTRPRPLVHRRRTARASPPSTKLLCLALSRWTQARPRPRPRRGSTRSPRPLQPLRPLLRRPSSAALAFASTVWSAPPTSTSRSAASPRRPRASPTGTTSSWRRRARLSSCCSRSSSRARLSKPRAAARSLATAVRLRPRDNPKLAPVFAPPLLVCSFREETGGDDDDEQDFEARSACLLKRLGITPFLGGTVVSVRAQEWLPSCGRPFRPPPPPPLPPPPPPPAPLVGLCTQRRCVEYPN